MYQKSSEQTWANLSSARARPRVPPLYAMPSARRAAEDDFRFIDFSALSNDEIRALASCEAAQRDAKVEALSAPARSKTVADFNRVTPMGASEEIAAALTFLLGVPGFALSFPALLALLWATAGPRAAALAALAVAPLAFAPCRFAESNLTSWWALACMRYFSFKGVYRRGRCPFVKGKPFILVAPPHGVFPYGNIATMICYPAFAGFSFKGLASSAVFRTPVIGQLLTWVGAIDASRPSATKALNAGRTIGISTGGVSFLDANPNPNPNPNSNPNP